MNGALSEAWRETAGSLRAFPTCNMSPFFFYRQSLRKWMRCRRFASTDGRGTRGPSLYNEPNLIVLTICARVFSLFIICKQPAEQMKNGHVRCPLYKNVCGDHY